MSDSAKKTDRKLQDVRVNLPQVKIVPSSAADETLGALAPNVALAVGLAVLIALAVPAVYFGEIDDDVDEVGAELVGGHVDGGGVAGDVDLGEDVEEVDFLEAAGGGDGVEEGLEGGQLGHEALDDFGEGLEDAVVVDAGGVEADGGVLEAGVEEVVADALDDVADGVGAVVVGEAVGFVDEDAVLDLGEGLLQVQDRVREAADGFHVVVLRVEDPDHGADAAEYFRGVVDGIQVVHLAGEVPDLEVHEGAAQEQGMVSVIFEFQGGGKGRNGSLLHCFFLDRVRGLEKQGFMGGHFAEDNVGDGGLATSRVFD